MSGLTPSIQLLTSTTRNRHRRAPLELWLIASLASLCSSLEHAAGLGTLLIDCPRFSSVRMQLPDESANDV